MQWTVRRRRAPLTALALAAALVLGDLAWAAEPGPDPQEEAGGDEDDSPKQVTGGPAPDTGPPSEDDTSKEPAGDDSAPDAPDSSSASGGGSGADDSPPSDSADDADSDDTDGDPDSASSDSDSSDSDSDTDDSDSDTDTDTDDPDPGGPGDDDSADDADDRDRDRDRRGDGDRRRDTADCFPGVDRDFGTTPCRATVSNGEETWTVRAIPTDDAADRHLVVEFDGPGRPDPDNDPGCSRSPNFDWTDPATSHWMFFTIGGGWDKEITATRKVAATGSRLARMSRQQEICFVAPYAFAAWDGRRLVKADYDRRRDEYTGILPPCREVSYGDDDFPESPCLDGRSYDTGRRTVSNRVLAPAHSQDPRPKNQTRRR